MNFNALFDGVWSSADLKYKKPQQEFFQALFNKLDFQKNQIAFWDDTHENVETGNKFGLQSHLYKDIEDFRAVHADLM